MNRGQFKVTETAEERFWSKVVKTDGCWYFTGHKSSNGYGRFWADGREHNAHRWIWEHTNGPLPPGVYALHECDNPACVRLDHLFTGTQSENMQDAARKGRNSMQRDPSVLSGDSHWTHQQPERRTTGERHGSAKLTWKDVENIRDNYAHGMASQRELASAFGVNPRTIQKIVTLQTWKLLTRDSDA